MITITGGKVKDVELPGIIGTIREAKTLDLTIEKEKIELEKEKEEVNTQKLENMMKALELYETAKEGGVDIEYALQQLETLGSLSEDLQFESEDIDDVDENHDNE